ncbi:MAG: hypothetical protein SGPRY_007589 [Prymnesium sp.]
MSPHTLCSLRPIAGLPSTISHPTLATSPLAQPSARSPSPPWAGGREEDVGIHTLSKAVALETSQCASTLLPRLQQLLCECEELSSSIQRAATATVSCQQALDGLVQSCKQAYDRLEHVRVPRADWVPADKLCTPQPRVTLLRSYPTPSCVQ